MTQHTRAESFIREHGLAAFCEPRHIKTRRHKDYPNLVLLKYDHYRTPREDLLARQCRGLILDEADDWQVVCYPYDRFFNHGEPEAATIDWESARVYEKVDGSLMCLWWYRGAWHVSTSGSPDASGEICEGGPTFAEKFWEVWKNRNYGISLSMGARQTTFMFELVCPKNRIVVDYTNVEDLVLHGMRDTRTHRELYSVNAFARHQLWHGWTSPGQILAPMGAQHLLSAANSRPGTQREGFVVVDKHFNRIKIKSRDYVRLHHLRHQTSERSLLDVVRRGEASEVSRYFPELKAQLSAMQSVYLGFLAEVEQAYQHYCDIPSQKEFALAVKHYPYSSVLFTARHKDILVADVLAEVSVDKILRWMDGD